MHYKNKDPGAERDAIQIANLTAAWFEEEIKRLIDSKYYHKSWTVLSTELRLVAIEEILRIFNVKLVEIRHIQRSNNWKYKAQDDTYPELKEDLKKWTF
jgi:hypothetical protein